MSILLMIKSNLLWHGPDRATLTRHSSAGATAGFATARPPIVRTFRLIL